MDDLFELERRGWEALSSGGDAGERFYAAVLREDAVMLFPGGIRIVGREPILQSLGSRPWASFRIEDVHVVELAVDVATLVYRVTAQRRGSQPYAALVSSTYVRNGEWRLVIHQQTPEL